MGDGEKQRQGGRKGGEKIGADEPHNVPARDRGSYHEPKGETDHGSEVVERYRPSKKR